MLLFYWGATADIISVYKTAVVDHLRSMYSIHALEEYKVVQNEKKIHSCVLIHDSMSFHIPKNMANFEAFYQT